MTRQILPVPNPVPSYWLRTPHAHADLRSTPRLPQESEVVVVGAGMAGVMSCYYVLKNGTTEVEEENGKGGERPKVVLIDARQLCSGATGRNGGHAKIQVKTLLNIEDVERREEMAAFVGSVRQELKKVVEEENIECEFELRRSLDVYTDTEEAETMRRGFEAARKRGEVWTREVAWVGPEMVEQVSSVKGAKGGFSVPAASFWPYKFVTGLLERMLERWPGTLNVQMNTPITSLSTATNGSHALHSDRGPLHTSTLILATNAYTSSLLPLFKPLIVPVRGTASHHTPKSPIHPHLSTTYNLNFGPGKGVDYLNPRPDGGIVVGGASWLFAPEKSCWYNNWDDAHLFPPHLGIGEYWDGHMQERFLGWEESGAVCDGVWTGIMGRTRDGMPFVGEVPGREGVWVLAGWNGGGMGLIAGCARVVGGSVNGGKEKEGEGGMVARFGCVGERMGEGE